MQHTESSVKIFFTKDYNRFNIINGNRQLNQAKINRIKKDIDEGLDVLRYCPVLVTEKRGKLDIIDGQHRFHVAKEMDSHVWYIISEDLTLNEIAKINSNTERWKDRDFINCYRQQGNDHYRVLEEFIDSTGFPITVCIKLLTKGTVSTEGGTTGKHVFISGHFEVKAFEKAKYITDKVKYFTAFPGHKTGPFIEAICKIIAAEKVSVDDIFHKWKADPPKLTMQSKAKDYIYNLEQIYNTGKHSRTVIY